MSSNIGASLTKQSIAVQLHEALGFSKQYSYALTCLFFETLREAVMTTGEVSIPGFGKFVRFTTRSRMGRNPKTGEAYPINARTTMKFYPSPLLKKQINEGSL